jgi:prolyl 4-hydroxylase
MGVGVKRRPLFLACKSGQSVAMNLNFTEVAEALVKSGNRAEARGILEQGARQGDTDALFTLAIWRLEGLYLQRDLAQARTLFALAARGGRGDALAIYIAFVANGIGDKADWPEAMRLLRAFAATDDTAREQCDLIEMMNLDEHGAPVAMVTPERLSDSPDVLRLPAIFTPAERAYLVNLAEPRLERSLVADPRSGRFMHDPVRTSHTAAFPLVLENPAIRALNRRIAAASGTLVTQGEPLQILSYLPGQQYHPHYDALAATDNQRVLTMLVYLNDDYAGGETHFMPKGPTVRGVGGDGLLFRNVDVWGRRDLASRHAGLPVMAGRKLIASRWIRARPLDLSHRQELR